MQLGTWILGNKKVGILIYAWENYGKFFFNEEIKNEATCKYENTTSFQINGVNRLKKKKKKPLSPFDISGILT